MHALRTLLRQRLLLSTLGAALALAAAGCASDADKPVVGRISALPAVASPADNPTTPVKVALGKQLFVDPRLSGSGKTACQSCHYRHLGWTDAKELSVRDDGKLNSRHTPSLYNVGHQSLWYWDGRAATLEAQITAAWRNQSGADPAKVAEALNALPGYRSQFEAAFGGLATPANIAQALGAYLRTKNSENSPWDSYEGGNVKAVSRDAVEGYLLFTGKGRCATCHVPPFYGNSTFFNIGLEHGKANPDPGRWNVTKAEVDRGAFKTPSLRSAALSAPYFHDGSVKTLREAVAYMAGGGRPDPNKSPLLQPTGLTPQEIDKVVAFITSLTSEEPWQPPALP